MPFYKKRVTGGGGMSESYDNSKIHNRQQAQDWQEVYA